MLSSALGERVRRVEGQASISRLVRQQIPKTLALWRYDTHVPSWNWQQIVSLRKLNDELLVSVWRSLDHIESFERFAENLMTNGGQSRVVGTASAGRNFRSVGPKAAAIFLLLVATTLGLSGLGKLSSAPSISSGTEALAKARDALAKARDMAAMLAERSPGARTTAELTKTKRKHLASPPHERALGKIRRPVLPPQFLKALAPELGTADLPTVVDLNPLIGPIAPPITLAEIPPGGTVAGPPATGFPGSPIGGGGGSFLSPPVINTPPLIPPPAVPEPATWAMMLMGFLGLGLQLRRVRGKLSVSLRHAM